MTNIPEWGLELVHAIDLPGFKYIPEYAQLRKGDNRNWQNIIFGISSYPEADLLELTFGTRIALVEDMIAPFIEGFASYHRYSNTVTSNLSKFYGQSALRLKYSQVSDLGVLKKRIEQFYFKDGGKAFLEQYQIPAEIEKVLNHQPLKPCALSFNPSLRAFRGLALASLLGSAPLAKVFHSHRQALQLYGVAPAQLSAFQKFRDTLMERQN